MRMGVMVSLRDFKSIRVPEADFLELLLFDGDIHLVLGTVMPKFFQSIHPSVEFVHVQEFMRHGTEEVLVDLASEDEQLRSRAVQIVGLTRDLGKELGGVPVIVHPGGIRRTKVDRKPLLSNLRRSLEELGPSGILLENMPWYYWFRKNERMIANICVSMDDMALFEDLVDGFVLDTCHGFLSESFGDKAYCGRFLERFGDKVKHIHASDARAPDKEGLQIGEGGVDFTPILRTKIPVLVEVWNGHLNGGEGFRIAIERLRKLEKE